MIGATKLSERKNKERTTGKIAVLRLDFAPSSVCPGEMLEVRVAVTAAGQNFEAVGVFVDLLGTEMPKVKPRGAARLEEHSGFGKEIANEAFRIAPRFLLEAGKTRVFGGRFQLPVNFEPTFDGQFADCEWKIRARIETPDGDADSEFQPFRVCLRS